MLLLAAPAEAASPRRIPPIDQCAVDQGFASFRAGLRKAIAAKDWAGLSALLADDVIVDFGGGAGKTAFSEAWDGAARPSRLWTEATAALSLGCSRDGKTYETPSFGRQLGDRSAVDYRFTFEKRGGHWRIAAFVAGD